MGRPLLGAAERDVVEPEDDEPGAAVEDGVDLGGEVGAVAVAVDVDREPW